MIQSTPNNSLQLNHDDPYWKLKPAPGTPEDEICSCDSPQIVYLAHVLSSNPIHCGFCRGEVHAETLGFDADTTERIANWNTVYGSVYRLWLDSGGYESWSLKELLSPNSYLNVLGLAAQTKLSTILPCYYLWFSNADQNIDHHECPLCQTLYGKHSNGFLVCEECKIFQ